MSSSPRPDWSQVVLLTDDGCTVVVPKCCWAQFWNQNGAVWTVYLDERGEIWFTLYQDPNNA